MKSTKIIYWTSTIIIFLFEGVMPILTMQSAMAKEGIKHLGYPDYFGPMLTGFKVLGTLVLILPQIPSRVKEWAYAGLAFDFIAAFISIAVIDGISAVTFFPILVLAILITSYVTFHKLQKQNVK